jgi:hypothetical protein
MLWALTLSKQERMGERRLLGIDLRHRQRPHRRVVPSPGGERLRSEQVKELLSAVVRGIVVSPEHPFS